MKQAAIAALLSVLSLSAAERLTIAPAEGTEFALDVEKTGLMSGKKHHLIFPEYSGVLEYDSTSASRSSVELRVKTGTIQVHDTWVKEKDREKVRKYAVDDELESAKYPEITFKSSAIVKEGNRYIARGSLTIHGVTKPAAVTVEVEGSAPPLRLKGSAPLKLSDFDLKRPSAALGAVGTKDEVTVNFWLVAK